MEAVVVTINECLFAELLFSLKTENTFFFCGVDFDIDANVLVVSKQSTGDSIEFELSAKCNTIFNALALMDTYEKESLLEFCEGKTADFLVDVFEQEQIW